MLREYNTIQKTILACVIEEDGELKELKKGQWEYRHKGKGATTTLLIFSVSVGKKPKVGDAIIFLDKNDICHCKKSVFDSKYQRLGMTIK